MSASEDAVPKTDSAPPAEPAPQDIDWNALRKTVAFLERARLSEWVAIMNNPRRNFWINFLAGVARGIGMVVGGTLVGVLFAFFSVELLKKAFQHAGGVPWVGSEMQQAIGFILSVVRGGQSTP